MIRRWLALLALIALPAVAQNVPTPEQFLGYKLGERFTPYSRILDYFHELAKDSNLITVHQFGETYEHRPLVLAVIASPKNQAAIDTIRQNVASLSDASTTPARAAEIAHNTPAIAWLAYGVHGNESSSSEAAMEVASTLLHDPEAAKILDHEVVLIDPLQNPDGRERYVQWFIRTRGETPNPNPDAFEHAEPWPGGRFNHYLIDMNRDWAWTSQRETKARVAEYRRWYPQVFVDLHEMGSNSTYFFPPDATPVNSNIARSVTKWLDVFGRANAAAFTARGWPFFVSEVFDLFYPGYGDSWPSLHGAIGMTYEVAGGPRGGLAFTRDDGTVLTLADRIARHYTSSMTTLQTTAANAEALLLNTYDALHAETNGETTFLVPPSGPNFQPLLDMLQRQGIEIGMLAAPATLRATQVGSDTAANQAFPPRTAVISTRQPLGNLVQTLLEKSPTFTKGFVEQQRQKTELDEPNDFYDLTSWSLPLAMNVDAFAVSGAISASVRPYERTAAEPFRPAAFGYIIDADDAQVYRAAGRMLAGGVKFSVSEEPLSVAGHTFARGSILILKGNNKSDLDATLQAMAHDAGVSIAPVESGWTEGGTALGSEKIHFIRDPKIALVGGPGVSSTSYGMLWHTFDIDTPVPHTDLALDTLRRTDLSHYRVLVLPDGRGYAEALGKGGIVRLQAWVRGGGTIIAVKGASAFLRDKDVEMSKLKPWEPPKKKDEKTPEPERYNEYRVPGATFRTTMNDRSYLTFGVPDSPYVLIEGRSEEAFIALPHKVDNIVSIDDDNPLVAGVAWPESIARVKGSVYLASETYGEGQVITFADEPHFRLFWRGTLPLLMNAVLYSPSFPPSARADRASENGLKTQFRQL